MKITVELLREHRACSDQVELFKNTFPDGCELSQQTWDAAISVGLAVLWCECLLTDPAWAAYDAVVRQAREAYRAVVSQAWEAYRAVECRAWEAYRAVERQAWAAYDAVARQALLEVLMSMEEVTC